MTVLNSPPDAPVVSITEEEGTECSSLEFDGSDDYVSVTDHTDLSFGSDDFTIVVHHFICSLVVVVGRTTVFPLWVVLSFRFFLFGSSTPRVRSRTTRSTRTNASGGSSAGQLRAGFWSE